MRRYRKYWDWNILAYLQELREKEGIGVVVVHWPVAHTPFSKCYNRRYTKALMNNFKYWRRRQAVRRQLPFVDLHDFLGRDAFLDTVHLGRQGYAKVAGRLVEEMTPWLPKKAPAAR